MTQHTELIQQYLDGEMPAQEATAFEQQVKTDPDLAYEVKLHQLAIAGVQHSEEVRFEEFKNRMKAIESKAKDETPIVALKPKRSGATRWVLRIAAVLIPLLFLYFLLPFSGGQTNPIAATTTELIEVHTAENRGETSPTPEATLLDEAIQLFEQENYEAALPIFDSIISENNNYRAAAQVLKADALYQQGKKVEALKVLKSIKEEDDTMLYERVQAIIKEME